MSNILILGASYGSLLATKLALAGHRVCLVCTAGTAELINGEGTIVRFPVKGRTGAVEVRSAELPGSITAAAPQDVPTNGFDLAVLAMQEAQYAEPPVRQLMRRLARARVPCLAIMNMPPLAYLRRIESLDLARLQHCYRDAALWEGFDPALVTLASPDPQAFRPVGEGKNVLQVGLPTNFKAARFQDDAHTALLRQLEADIDAARFTVDGEAIELPVRLKVHESLFVPLAKWPMLVTGNYRCIRADGMIPIQQAVHGDLALSREIYEWVADLCCRLGAERADLVPFEKYAAAAASLQKPSSAARALFGGASHIERVDSLVHCLAAQFGLAHPTLRETVRLVDARLERNRMEQEAVAA
ncbi:hypothetical protein, partial [Ramlibacter sp.]|uniref:hypothetical protein n=1 Tax=Ramlibacter sp. TaxID=1917967 RepID=UPI00260B1446